MTAKRRKIELDQQTADRLEGWAEARGVSVAKLLADLVGADDQLPRDWESMRKAGRGPWAPEILAGDARRLAALEPNGEGVPWEEVEAWMQSWGTAEELPPPKPRKL